MISTIIEDNRWLHIKRPNIVLIFGCDIKDATKYKIANDNTWMFDITDQLNRVEQHVNRVFNKEFRYYLWKKLGDEILFCIFPKDLIELQNITNKCYTVFENKESIEEKMQLKYRLFCAGYHFLDGMILVESNGDRSDIEEYENYKKSDYINYRIGKFLYSRSNKGKRQANSYNIGDVKEYDFIGPDIDIGFRIGKFTRENEFIISDKVANLIKSFELDNFQYKITNRCKLKGVWNDYKYPKIQLIKKNRISNTDLESIYCEVGILEKQNEFISMTKHVLLQSDI